MTPMDLKMLGISALESDQFSVEYLSVCDGDTGDEVPMHVVLDKNKHYMCSGALSFGEGQPRILDNVQLGVPLESRRED